MKTLQIIEQLLNRYHLNDNELTEAENIIRKLDIEIKSRKPYKVEFTRVNNDIYGNPRYVCHFLDIADNYQEALKLAKSLGGRKFNNKQYGGGVVFQSYNIIELENKIRQIKTN